MKKFFVTEVTSCYDCPHLDGEYAIDAERVHLRCMHYGTYSEEGKDRIPDNCRHEWHVKTNRFLVPEDANDCSNCRHQPDLDKVCDVCFRNPNLRDSWDKTGE